MRRHWLYWCWQFLNLDSQIQNIGFFSSSKFLFQNCLKHIILNWCATKQDLGFFIKFMLWGTSLVAQWLRIRLPIQGTQVRALVRQDPTCRGAAKPMRRNYWVCALEPVSHNYWAHVPELLKPACLEPVLCNKRSHCNEKPAHRNEE